MARDMLDELGEDQTHELWMHHRLLRMSWSAWCAQSGAAHRCYLHPHGMLRRERDESNHEDAPCNDASVAVDGNSDLCGDEPKCCGMMDAFECF